MKKIAFSFMLIFIVGIVLAQKSSDDFTGNWFTPEGTTIFINKNNNIFSGKFKEGDGHVLKEIIFDDGKWRGKIGDPAKGKYYNCELSIKEKGKLNIVVKAGIIRKTIVWSKIN